MEREFYNDCISFLGQEILKEDLLMTLLQTASLKSFTFAQFFCDSITDFATSFAHNAAGEAKLFWL